MNKNHHYKLLIEWTGNHGTGTTSYRDYERSFSLSAQNKPEIKGSADPAFRGDPNKYNPEEMLVAALSSCHMLSYLHLCAVAGIIVAGYSDEAEGTMVYDGQNPGRFTQVVLHPRVSITDSSKEALALSLHEQAHQQCFIANSVNFPVNHEALCEVKK